MNALPAASIYAPEVDHLFWALIAISLAVLLLVFGLMIHFTVRYRAGHEVHRVAAGERSWAFEVSWTAATLFVFFGLFIWGADLYLRMSQPPETAFRIHVVGKQWMWKVQYPDGQREINALHLPLGRVVQLIMTSEDVIHDFSVPAFRIKHDVLPDRYDTIWVQPTRTGTFHLFCTQFCGLDHAHMTGEVTVMPEGEFQKWLGSAAASPDLVAQGHQLFVALGCAGCHLGNSSVRAPSLTGLYGNHVPLSDGRVVVADEGYIRDSILMPKQEIVAGYQPVMPSFAGQIGDDELIQLIAYVKSLGDKEAAVER